MIFKKKEVTPPDVGEEDVSEIQEEIEQKELGMDVKSDTSTGGGGRGGKGVSEYSMSADIERLKAQVESFGELRKANSERFMRVGEQIGELRTMIINNEKKMTDLEVKATRAYDLVEEVQPENLKADVAKVDIKVETLKERLKEFQALVTNLIEEVKSINNSIKLFRGSEGLLKLNEEIKKELIIIQKTKSVVETHSDKVEQIFMDVEKNYVKFQTLKASIEDVANAVKDMNKDFNNLRVEIQKKPTKTDILDIHDVLDSQRRLMERVGAGYEEKDDEMKTIRGMQSQVVDAITKNRVGIEDIQKKTATFEKNINSMLNCIEGLIKRVTVQKAAKPASVSIKPVEDVAPVSKARIEGLKTLKELLRDAIKNLDETEVKLKKARKSKNKKKVESMKKHLKTRKAKVRSITKKIIKIKKSKYK